MFSKKSMLLLPIFFVFIYLVSSIASASGNILFYNNNNGNAAIGNIDSSGKFHQTDDIKGVFVSGWSDIISTP